MEPEDIVKRRVSALIATVGGGATIATAFGCSPAAISNWVARGWIPKARWIDLIELAKSRKVSLTVRDIRAAHNASQRSAA